MLLNFFIKRKWTIYLLLFLLTYPIYMISYPTIILILSYIYFPWNKGFWSQQPIHSSTYGIIQDPYMIQINNMKLSANEEWWSYHHEDIDLLYNFLNKYYEKDLIITREYIYWLIKNQNYDIYGIKKNGELIGTIGGSWITYQIGNKIANGYYVDILCVNSKYRKQGYAVKLIKKMIESWKNKGGNINLFKLDTIQITPSPDFIFHYYLLDKEKMTPIDLGNETKLELITNKNIEQAYQYFQTQMKKYSIREIYTLEKFQKWILGDIKITQSYLSINNNNQIVGMVNLMINKYNKNNKHVSTIDIVYLLGNKLEIIKQLLEWNYQYYIILDLYDHSDVIKLLNMEKLYDTRYYFYNYELLNKYKKTDIGIHRF